MASEGWPTVFEDSGELEHVIELLSEYTKIPDAVPESEVDSTLRPNSPLPVLEERLRELLALAGIGADCYDEEGVIWPVRPIDTLQEAAIDVYRHAHLARRPIDVRTCLPALTLALWKLHGAIRDCHFRDVEEQRKKKRKSMKSANAVRQRKAAIEHERWREEAEKVRIDLPHIADNNSEVARKVIARLGLTVTERAVTDVI